MLNGVALYVAVPTVLLIGLALAGAAKLILGARSRLSLTTSVIVGLVGASVGAALAQAIAVPAEPGFLATSVFAVFGTVVLMALAEQFRTPPAPSTAELIADGESERLEFKSSARHNLHTGSRDDRIELVVAKTVAGFLNGDGGTLLVGVCDDGEILGLDDDLQHMKSPDLDRYELWVRDYLARTLGAATGALVDVTFPTVDGRAICRIDAAASPRPVFLRPMRSDAVLFSVRIGNTTRELTVDQAIVYAADHFPQERVAGWRPALGPARSAAAA